MFFHVAGLRSSAAYRMRQVRKWPGDDSLFFSFLFCSLCCSFEILCSSWWRPLMPQPHTTSGALSQMTSNFRSCKLACTFCEVWCLSLRSTVGKTSVHITACFGQDMEGFLGVDKKLAGQDGLQFVFLWDHSVLEHYYFCSHLICESAMFVKRIQE